MHKVSFIKIVLFSWLISSPSLSLATSAAGIKTSAAPENKAEISGTLNQRLTKRELILILKASSNLSSREVDGMIAELAKKAPPQGDSYPIAGVMSSYGLRAGLLFEKSNLLYDVTFRGPQGKLITVPKLYSVSQGNIGLLLRLSYNANFIFLPTGIDLKALDGRSFSKGIAATIPSPLTLRVMEFTRKFFELYLNSLKAVGAPIGIKALLFFSHPIPQIPGRLNPFHGEVGVLWASDFPGKIYLASAAAGVGIGIYKTSLLFNLNFGHLPERECIIPVVDPESAPPLQNK